MNKNLNNIKLIVLDIDKTIANNKNEITEYTKKVLQKAVKKGIYVILCSGRTNSYVVDKSKSLKITPIVISNNGSLVYNYEREESIYIDELKEEDIEKILYLVKRFQINCKLNAITKRYYNENTPKEEQEDSLSLEKLKEKQEKIVQVYAGTKNYETMQKFIEEIKASGKYSIENKSFSLVRNHRKDDDLYWVDIVKSNNSKGNAITKLRDYLGIKKEEIICFGDHINDFSMFKSCGIRCAVDNAMEELKAQADYITLSNEEDGVTKFINQQILKD